MWQRKNFEEAADQIASKFVESAGQESINQLATKVASLHNLNPESIRTVVRLANVSAFEKMFAKEGEKKAADRMFEFEVGDPEVVINNLHADAKVAIAPQEKTAYDQAADYYGDLYPVAQAEKVAASGEENPQPPMPKGTKAQFMAVVRNAKDKCTEKAKEAEYHWLDSLEKAAHFAVSNVQQVEKLAEFEKNAAAHIGEDILPELTIMRKLSTKGEGKVFGGEKIAEVLRTQVAVFTNDQQPIIGLLKEALVARKNYETCKRNIAWIDENMAQVK